MLTVLIDWNLLACLIGGILQFFHIGVGMTAQHEVAPLYPFEKQLIRIFRILPAEVGDADHDIALLLLAEDVDVLLCRLGGIEEGDALAVTVEHQTLHGWREGEDSNLHALALQRDIGLYQILEHCARAVVVGADDGEIRHAEDARHIVESEVELMVADGSGIVAHQIHQAYLYLTLEERVITRTLREVARVEEQQVGMLLALLLQHIDTAQETAPASYLLIVDVRIDGNDRGMGIVGVQHHELLVLLGTSRQARQQYYKYNKV